MVLGRPDVWPVGDIALAQAGRRGQGPRPPARSPARWPRSARHGGRGAPSPPGSSGTTTSAAAAAPARPRRRRADGQSSRRYGACDSMSPTNCGEPPVAEDLAYRRRLADVAPVVVGDPLELRPGGRRVRPRRRGGAGPSRSSVVSVSRYDVGGRRDASPGRPHRLERRRRGRRAVGDGVEDRLDPEALAALHPDEALVPREVADHPRDRVHRLEPAPARPPRTGRAGRAPTRIGRTAAGRRGDGP